MDVGFCETTDTRLVCFLTPMFLFLGSKSFFGGHVGGGTSNVLNVRMLFTEGEGGARNDLWI